jgi:Cysteine rich repeat
MVRNFCFVIALLTVSSAAWAANNQPPQDPVRAAQERACRGDAHRFCREDLADEFRVASCLQEHVDHVSHACRTVLEGH